MKKVFRSVCSLVIALSLAIGLVPNTFAADDGVISSIDFEDAKAYIGNITGKTTDGDMSYTIVPANAGNPNNRAKVKVVKLADQETFYPGVNDSRMGEKAILFERSGSRNCMTRWNDVFDMSATEVGEKYRASVWVYTADVVEAGSGEGKSVIRFFVSKSGKYDSSDPTTKQHILNKSVPDGVWTEIAFEFEMTEKIQKAGANSFRLDSAGTEGSYAQTIFLDNFKLEKADGSSAADTTKPEEKPAEEKEPSSASGKIEDYDKIAGQSYETAVNVLYALGVVSGDDKGKFNPEKELTRAEILSILLRMLGPVGTEITTKAEFDDVPSSHWAYKSIGTGVALGIVSGDGNGKFRPDDTVTGAEATKMLVSALGYDAMADMNGGYPVGYTVTANKLKLLDKAAVDANAPILRWQCARMVYNALEIALLEPIYTSKGTSGSSVSEDMTVLSEYHDVKRIKGMLTSVPEASLSTSLEVVDGYATIDNVKYKCNLRIEDLLGKNCVFYIKEIDVDDWEIIYCYESNANDETKEFLIEDIVSITATSTSAVRITYSVDSKNKTFNFDGGNIVYNKEEITFATQSDFQTFLDNNVKQGVIRIVRNDTADTMFIENYKAYVVSRASNSIEKIFYIVYGKDTNSQGVIDLSAVKYTIYDADGSVITLDDLESEDVISVYQNNAGDKLNIYRSTAKITGTIENMEYLKGDGPYDWQPPVTSIQYVKKLDANVADWTNSHTDSNQVIYSNEAARLISLLNGAGNSAPSGYTTPTITNQKLSYSNLLAATEPGYTYGTDTVVDELFYDEAGQVKTGNGIKMVADAGSQMMRFNNAFATVTPGTATEPARIKFRFALYMTDIQTRQGVADTSNSVTSLTIRVALRTTGDMQYKNITVPVNQWYICEPEWTLTGNVSNIHGMRLDLGPGYGVSNANAYTRPYAKTIYHSGNIQMWMDEEVTATPVNPPETCEYEATIGGKKYYIADTLDDGLLLWSPLGVGSSATFLLDHNGRIAGYIPKNAQTGNYGLLMKVLTGFDEPGKVKILTSKGKLETFECAEKISAFDGSQIVKQPLSHFIAGGAANAKDDWYIWSKDNSTNFCMTPKTWLEAANKSDAASRKLVYYKTNSAGLITQILVPSMPLSMRTSKVKMLRDFTGVSATSSYGTLLYRKGYDYLVTSNQDVTPSGEKQSYKISDNILVYYVSPNDYGEEDYKISSLDSLDDGSYLMQVYSFSDDETADAIVVCPQNKYPSTLTSVMVHHIGMDEDGTYTLYGYSDGEEFSCVLPDDLHINERLWYRDSAHTVKLTRDNIEAAKNAAEKPYQSTYEANGGTTPYVHEANLRRGDIVSVEVSKGAAVSVEVVSRVSDGIGASRSIHTATDIGSMLDQAVTTKVGKITGISDDGQYVKLQSYAWTVSGFIVSAVGSNQASSEISSMELMYKIADLPITICDVGTRHIYEGSIDDLEYGDEAIIFGKITKPISIYVWKN